MFTGIIETLGSVTRIRSWSGNVDFDIAADFVSELKIDQSIAHNGVCLTVTGFSEQTYKVTAVAETLSRTNLNKLREGDKVNLERCVPATGRFDGHFVQGHVDQIGTCIDIIEKDGSWMFYFRYDASKGNITVEKGSVTINGISLTVVHSEEGELSVAVIPFTFAHTNLQFLKVGDEVNLEFDILGKYIKKYFSRIQ